MVLSCNEAAWRMLLVVGVVGLLFLLPSKVFAFEFNEDAVITEDTTWTKAESPYVFTGTARVEIQFGNTLTIEPGVVLKFDERTYLSIFGDLYAVGTEAEPIIFTSLKDDSVEGDTNGDGSATFPSRRDNWRAEVGSWRNLDSLSVIMSFVEFRYNHDGFVISNADATLDNLHFATSTYGLYAYLGTTAITEFTAENIYGNAVTLDTVMATVDNIIISDSYDAIDLYGSDVQMKNIVLSGMNSDGIGVYWSTATLTDVIIIDSPYSRSDMIDVYDSEVVLDDIYIENIGRGAALGVYNAHATMTNAVLHNGDGMGVSAYAWTDGASVTLDNVTVTDFLDYGVSLNEVSMSIRNSLVDNNFIGIESYFGESEDALIIENTSVAGNILYGLVDYGSASQIQAQGNWWGDASGPYHEIDNPDGIGDTIEGDVDFSNWLTAPPGEAEEIDPLLLQYAPTLQFHEDEDYFPMNVESFVTDSSLWSKEGIGDTVIRNEEDLTFSEFESIVQSTDTSDYYLAYSDPDTKKSIDLLEAKAKYDRATTSGEATTTVYVHKMTDGYTDDFGVQHDFIVLQYWYFYAMNNWGEAIDSVTANNHEGDWESVFIFLDATMTDPLYIAYSSHLNDGYSETFNLKQYDSVRREWSSDEVERNDDTVTSSVALGSHANYPNNGNGVHKIPLQSDDVTSNNGVKLQDNIYSEIQGSSWFSFEGNWGSDSVKVGGDGPQGPRYIDLTGQVRLEKPVEWAGLDKVTNLTVSSSADTFSFASSTVGMWFSNALEVGTELSVSIHDEFINFGTNVGNINLLPKFWDFGTSLVNGTFDVSVSLAYTQEQLLLWNVDEEFMQVYLYNDVENVWQPVPSHIDTDLQSISFDTTHFSRYAIGSPILSPLAENIVVESHVGTYHQDSDIREVLVSLHNKGTTTLSGTVRIIVHSLTQEGVELRNANGITTSGDAYIDLVMDPLEMKKKIVLPALLFTLPTTINASPKANEKAQKQNAKVKQFNFEVGVYTYSEQSE